METNSDSQANPEVLWLYLQENPRVFLANRRLGMCCHWNGILPRDSAPPRPPHPRPQHETESSAHRQTAGHSGDGDAGICFQRWAWWVWPHPHDVSFASIYRPALRAAVLALSTTKKSFLTNPLGPPWACGTRAYSGTERTTRVRQVGTGFLPGSETRPLPVHPLPSVTPAGGRPCAMRTIFFIKKCIWTAQKQLALFIPAHKAGKLCLS